ncbi:MAG: hypothetical protein HFJ17_00180 [Clostridia bacterium]|nr:hypothetical protein [Clostridia bacterium]
MNFTGKRIIQKTIAALMVIILILADFAFVGASVISYAIDMVATNNNNVEFAAYFVDKDKQKVTQIDSNINAEDLKVFVEISVKNEGYFNGELSIDDASFIWKDATENEFVKKVEGNKVTLNKISAGTTALIELGVKYLNSNEIKVSSLSQDNKINLTGKYVNSKKDIDIKGSTSVRINWVSPEDIDAKLKTEILTNAIYKTGESNKRIVQVLVDSKLADNSYPVKSTDINLNVPEGVEEVKVHSRTTNATNGNAEFNTENYNYDSEKGTLTINLVNKEHDGKANWNKACQDELVITYIYPEDRELANTEINVNSKIVTYDDKELKAESKNVINEEKNGIVTSDIIEREETIFKGKLYTGEERIYNSTTDVYVDYFDAIDEVKVKENTPVFMTKDEEKKANIEYKQSRIKKSDFINIFGEEGTIEILDQDESVVANINKDSETDDNGYINISYNDGVTSINVNASKPVSNGVLNIEHKKSILNSNLSREDIKELKAIKEEVKVNSNSTEKMIDLKEAKSQVEVDVNKETLTTKNINKELLITTTLLTKDEDKALYKNPKIKIELPKNIEKIENAKCKLLYGEGLKIKNPRIKDEDGRKFVEIDLEGSQEKYSKEAIVGTKVLLQADVMLKATSVNKEEKITVNVVNENTNETVKSEEKIELINFNSIITTNNIKEYNVETSNNGGSEKRTLDVESNESTATVQSQVINNESAKITDVKILGELPTNSSKNNMGISLVEDIRINSNNGNKVNVYYTEEENATDDVKNADNKWKKDITAKAKKYLIVVDKLDVGEEVNYSYKIKIPSGLSYNLAATEGYEVHYKNNLETQKVVKATEVTLTTGVGAEISQTVKASVAERSIEDGSEVKTGEIIKYEVTVENVGNKDAEGVTVTGTIPEGTKKVELKKVGDEEGVERPGIEEGEVYHTTKYVETDENSVTFDKFDLKARQKVVLTYEVKVQEGNEEGKDIACEIVSTYNKNTTKSNITHKLKKADISAELSTESRNKDVLNSGYKYEYCLDIKNNSEKDKEDIKVKIENNELLEVSTLYYTYENQRYVLNNENNANEYVIEKIKAGDTIRVWIVTMVRSVANNIEQAKIRAVLSDDKDTYYSNIIKEDAEIVKVDMSVASKTNSDKKDNYVAAGNDISYHVTLKNNGKLDAETLVIRDEISDYLTIKDVKVDGKEVKYDKEAKFDNGKSYTVLRISSPLKAGNTAVIDINTKVNDIPSKELITITNKVYANNVVNLATAEGDTYYIKNKENSIVSEVDADKKAEGYFDNKNENNNVENNNGNNNNNENNNTENNEGTNNQNNETKYTIAGTVWYDENKNGARGDNEQKLSDVNVYLLNSDTNEVVANTKSGENGTYTFTDIAKGEYIVVFEYDTGLYIPTTYQAKGVEETQNSDAIQSTIKLNNEQKTAAVTDSIKLNKNITDIDLGLIKAEKFDLELNKYVSKMTIVNSNETKVYEFNKSTLAKAEIAAKYLKDSTAVIEYTIEIKNTGELSGYVQSIADHKPTDISFSSDLNKDWYVSGNYLYNDSMKNVEIKAGETKEFKLILSKKMTESNTGLTNNTAEIVKAYNNNGVADIDSTPGNMAQEDDLGSADIIISVKTGALVSYITLTLSTIIILAGAAYMINKKIIDKSIKM